jgi:hypothetical protein
MNTFLNFCTLISPGCGTYTCAFLDILKQNVLQLQIKKPLKKNPATIARQMFIFAAF